MYNTKPYDKILDGYLNNDFHVFVSTDFMWMYKHVNGYQVYGSFAISEYNGVWLCRHVIRHNSSTINPYGGIEIDSGWFSSSSTGKTVNNGDSAILSKLKQTKPPFYLSSILNELKVQRKNLEEKL